MRVLAPILILVLGSAALSACGNESGGKEDAGPSGDVEAEVVGGDTPFGAGCIDNADCAAGLFCMQSDFAPGGWCTVFCDEKLQGDHCVDPALKGVGALCIKMPEGFRGPIKPFCAMKCDNTAECTAVWKTWERCAKPSYKNENLYNDLPTRVCEAPSAHGHKRVDPLACQWEDQYTAPRYNEAKQVCKGYCTYLKSCQLFDTKTRKLDCCNWHCFQKATPQGKVDEDFMSELKCYTQAFYVAYRGTPRICTGPPKDCGDPDPMHD